MAVNRAVDNSKSVFAKFIKRESSTILQLIPDRALRNYHTDSLAKAIAEFYSPIRSRVQFKGGIGIKAADLFSFRILLTKQQISFYLITPERLQDHFKQKILSVWEKATVKTVPALPALDPAKSSCCELGYRRHDIFSLATDKDTNAPLSSILAASAEMEPEDMAVIDILFDPADRVEWEYDAKQAYEKFQKGKMPHRTQLSFGAAIKGGFNLINSGLNEAQSAILEAGGTKQKQVTRAMDPERQMMIAKGLSPGTTSKLHSATLKTFIRIAAQSPNKERAALIMKALAGAYKDITGDNELVRKDKRSNDICKQIMTLSRPIAGGIQLSTAEAGKLMQLPTAQLQEAYPIESIRQREIDQLPEELFLDNVKSIPIGDVTIRGVTRKARIPIDSYADVKLKHVYDALCTPTMATGQMGCGKTEGLGITWAHGFVLNGLSAFLIDTADGELARKVEDSLPADFPDEKIIHIELDDKRHPVPLNWGDVASRKILSAEVEDEFEALEMAERLTGRLIDYIDGNSKSQELTERMRQYLTSAARATLVDPTKSLLDVELALSSPAYRAELLADPKLSDQLDVIQNLRSLQDKSISGGDSAVIDPIVSRLKMFSENQGLSRLFLQPNKLGKDGRPLLDFRHIADNPEGGYGYLVTIHASQDAWDEDGQELILSFVQDKILMTAFSRVDIPQDERKPFLNLIDEPHKFIKKAARLYKSASVELRKYRNKIIWLAHYMSQMGAAAQAVASGGCQYTQYKTQDLRQFEELAHAFAPFEPEELYKTLPDKWQAVNKIRLPKAGDCPAFIAQMEPPPKPVKSREERRKECAEIYGGSWKEVSEYINATRQKYIKKDDEWHRAQEQARINAELEEKRKLEAGKQKIKDELKAQKAAEKLVKPKKQPAR